MSPLNTTYERGEQLGCPDCHTGIEHCCPYVYADALPEPRRTRILRHMRGYFTVVGGHRIAPVVDELVRKSTQDGITP